MPTISVITVVKDDDEGFARSLTSLIEQESLEGIEFVVGDSSSSGTKIPQLLSGFPGRVTLDYEWSPPRGIYAAMNSALDRATGDYCYFLNAGDRLFDPAVLGQVMNMLDVAPVWAYGPVEIVEATGSKVITPPWNYNAEQAALFGRGHFPPHQGTFARCDALRSFGGFDTAYRVAADYAAFLKLTLLGAPLELPFVIASFVEGGTSTRHWQESFREFHRARQEILHPTGMAAFRERWETARHHSLVFAHREIRPRLSWLTPWNR